jgi:hypothetical protein
LTFWHVAGESDTLALLFPWRISAVIMPIATAVVFGRVVLAARGLLERRAFAWAGGGALVVLALAGLAIMVLRQGFQSGGEETPMLNYVHQTKAKGDVYLIPVPVPDLKKITGGSISGDFKPLAAKRKDPRLIPIDLQRFRLATEAPIFVDFKAIPYQDTEVLEWKRRLDLNQRFYEHLDAGKVEPIRKELLAEGITHIVTRTGDKTMPGLERLWGDDAYTVYVLSRPKP